MLLGVASCGFAPLRSAGASSSDVGWRWEAIGDGGLAYAIDPQLCSSLWRRAAELFVTCDEVHSVVHEALSAWARTSSVVQFRDVSAQCESDGEACAAADVYVTSASKGDGLAECVYDDCDDTAASVLHRTEAVAPNSTVIRHATIRVNRDLCWQLDPSFCASLSASQLDAVRVLLLLAFLALGLPPLLLWVIHQLPRLLRVSCRQRGCCCSQLRRGVDNDDDDDDGGDDDGSPSRPGAACNTVRFVALCGGLGSSPLWWSCWLVVPPLLYAQMVLPCSECLDLRAALAHEAGHVLGLSHPDTAALQGRNLRARPPPPSSPSPPPLPPLSCEPVDVTEETAEVQPSIMLSRRTFSQVHGACPRRDDVLGLEHLYPSCRHRHHIDTAGDVDDASVDCTSPPARRGWCRLLLWALLPAAGLGLLLRLFRAVCTRVAARRRPTAAVTATMLKRGAARGDGTASTPADEPVGGDEKGAAAAEAEAEAGAGPEAGTEVEVLRRQLDETRALLHAAEAEHERWLTALAADLGAATKANEAAAASRTASPNGAAPSGAESAPGALTLTAGTTPGADGEDHAPSAAVDAAVVAMTVSCDS